MMMLRMRFLNVCRQPSFCNEHPANKDKAHLRRLRLCFYAGWSVAPIPSRLAVVSVRYTEFADWHLLSHVYIPGNLPFHIDEVR